MTLEEIREKNRGADLMVAVMRRVGDVTQAAVNLLRWHGFSTAIGFSDSGWVLDRLQHDLDDLEVEIHSLRQTIGAAREHQQKKQVTA